MLRALPGVLSFTMQVSLSRLFEFKNGLTIIFSPSSEPPLEEDEIPEGEYLCKRCCMLEKMELEQRDQKYKTIAHSLKNILPPLHLDGPPKLIRQCAYRDLKTNGTTHDNVESSESLLSTQEKMTLEEDNEDDVIVQRIITVERIDDAMDNEACEFEAPVIEPEQTIEEARHDESCATSTSRWDNSPLSILIKAARLVNPVQFQLPNEYNASPPLPGMNTKVKSNEKAPKRLQHELANGIVPLPAKLCFSCNRSCKKASLIQCDFCPILYHADCLDPPLTALPVGRWMCPNHAEHVMEQKLLTSTSLTERIKLWDRFNGHLDQDAVKLTFLKKSRNKEFDSSEPSRLSAPIRIEVPRSIKAMYQNPPEPIPLHGVYVGTPDLEVQRMATRLKLSEKGLTEPTRDDQETWLTGIVSLQSSIAEFMETSSIEKPSSRNADQILMALPQKKSLQESVKNWMDKEDFVEKSKKNAANVIKAQSTASNNTAQAAKKDLKQELSSLQDIGEISLDKLDDKLIRALAYQRLKQLLPNGKELAESSCIPEQSPCDSELDGVLCGTTTIKSIFKGEIKARALLCPVYVKGSKVSDGTVVGTSFSMSYRTFSIGRGLDNDVVLSTSGHCNFISAKHACIFYDQVSLRMMVLNTLL